MTTTSEALEQIRALVDHPVELHSVAADGRTVTFDFVAADEVRAVLASVDPPAPAGAANIDLRARELAETVVKAATSLKEWRDGDFARQAQRIDAVQALLEPRMRAADVSPAPPAAQEDR